MPELTYQQAYELAFQYHQAGRLAEAEELYRQLLAALPNQPDTLHMLGVLAGQVGRHDAAIELIRLALVHRPAWPEALNNLGEVLRLAGQFNAAIDALQKAINLAPGYIIAYGNLSLALNQIERWEESIKICYQGLDIQPAYGKIYKNLGVALVQLGCINEAIEIYRKAIDLCVDEEELLNDLGVALSNAGELEQAVAAFRQVITHKPDFFPAYNNLGVALSGLENWEEAAGVFRQVIARQPAYADAHYNLGKALSNQGNLDEAKLAYQQAIALQPDHAEAYNNLGVTLVAQGQLDDAIAVHHEAVALKPTNAVFRSSLLFSLHYHPAYDAAAIAEEHRRWAREQAEPLRHLIQAHPNDRTPERRLRIGYVSPDFREHPIGHFLLPLLEHHDREQFKIIAYAQVTAPDKLTEQLRAHTEVWRNTVGLSDDQLAELIRADQIDILVDLAMHTSNNRLLVFARKPAPVQVTYLAYVGSTGLSTMDYRFSDPYLDPSGRDESIYSEKTFRLAGAYWCYRPTELAALPVREKKQDTIRFGCLNNYCKINEPLIGLWAKILQSVPDSRLLIHAYQGDRRQQILDRFASQAIAAERIEFVGKMPRAKYFQTYQSLDITLDTTPYAGGTTTCDSLWMGVPVVTLAGERAVGRGGVSILTNVGLPELIAQTSEEYIQIAVALASDPPRLQKMRSTLRERMQASPLMDAPNYVRQIEAAYRQMWRTWCACLA